MSNGEQYGNAASIAEVIEQLDRIIANAMQEKACIGYFAALYRMVTVEVQQGILQGRFQDGARMETFDVIFANRFLDAYNGYLQNKSISECWKSAFDFASSKKGIILQHLVLGMNAHINYDLGIAAAQVCPGGKLQDLYQDFIEINKILASLVDQVEEEIGSLSPWIGLAEHLGPNLADGVINFSISKARDFAWSFASQLAAADSNEQLALLVQKDKLVEELAYCVATPTGWVGKLLLHIIRMRESRDIAHNIAVLNGKMMTNALPGVTLNG